MMPQEQDYPRDMIGYGRKPVFAGWPEKAKIAVQFVLNYEEGGESCVLHGDKASEQFLSEIIGASAYPARHLSIESVYEYGSRVGVWRIRRSTVYPRPPEHLPRWRACSIASLRATASRLECLRSGGSLRPCCHG